jgi:hypothetical protein
MNTPGVSYDDIAIAGLRMCAAVCTFPPTSFVRAILTAGYLGHAMVSHPEIGGALFTAILSGLAAAVVLFGGLYLRDRRSRTVAPFAGQFTELKKTGTFHA